MPQQKFFQHFNLHAAGQGFFYSGIYGHEKSETPYASLSYFTFVFDCGSFNKESIKGEIELFKAGPKYSQVIDLLIISHFDADHVNHIPALLDDGMQVKEVVAPFLNFSERFFLALYQINEDQLVPDVPEDNDVIQLMVNPVGYISGRQEGDVEFIFIKSDNENPPFVPQEGGNDFPSDDNGTFTFGFEGSTHSPTVAESKDLNLPAGKNVKTVTDSQKGLIQKNGLKLTEFLFYRKQMGSHADEVFELVYQLFIEKHSSSFKDPNAPTIDEICSILKHIRGATVIKEIFREAKKKFNADGSIPAGFTNMNTTALALLHANAGNNHTRLIALSSHEASQKRIRVLEKRKFDGTNPTISWIDMIQEQLELHEAGEVLKSYEISDSYPNTLLTSDMFLLNTPDVEAFYRRYEKYWNSFWLFQIPHHGAAYNSNQNLYSRLEYPVYIFINYGIQKVWGGTWRHPSPDVIQQLNTYHPSPLNLLAVNECIGYQFRVEIIKWY